MKVTYSYLLSLLLVLTSATNLAAQTVGKLSVSANRRFIQRDGKPFFWLGDTGWLLFVKLDREAVDNYLEDRHQKGFNVIQVMVVHDLRKAVNVYGDSAFVNNDLSKPLTTPGASFASKQQYDFWDHVDYVVNKAASKGIYLGMVPVWGSNIKGGLANREQAAIYTKFLVNRYKRSGNIIWLNGGDIKGSDSAAVWKTIGTTLKKHDPNHLVTFHPRGRSSSSEWFHNENWLDFDMFQSGHKSYAQDTTDIRIGEDNWRYVRTDFGKLPKKPSIDGEPSYEKIPQGLHDTLAPLWTDADVRRYGYWSVFAGGFGYTYGDNTVMQFRRPGDGPGAYGAKDYWYQAIHDPGSSQVQWLKKLILGKPFFERIPDQSLIANQGEKYNYLAATRGRRYAFVYSYTGRTMKINMGKIAGTRVKTSWYDPRTGKTTPGATVSNSGVKEFGPPGEEKEGNDWVLVLESI
ncbi:DUF4038 domain-containing protein [Pedobacter sp. HMF7056]|uniref:DUF4038 domain-containing protein n=2 Tax=Hufsiella ginkgonis TaxID=2695274 RepID=A0A7K1XW52_9SPHI|nr:DUF4038 domain-containing protein [Hufsiella ginkgonis]